MRGNGAGEGGRDIAITRVTVRAELVLMVGGSGYGDVAEGTVVV